MIMNKTSLRNRLPRFLIENIGTTLIIVLVTLILKWLEGLMEIQVIALLYLLPVLATTVFWGLTSGILAGLLAFLAFNFAFIQPYYTFHIHKTQDLITLIIFFIVAVVLSQFVGQAREAVRLAKKRESEATRMYELISALAGLVEIQNVMSVLAEKLLEAFDLDMVEIVAQDRLSSSNYSLSLPEGKDPTGDCDLIAAMFTARNSEGEIRLWLKQKVLSAEESRLLAAFAHQGALAIERIHLFKRENMAKVLEESDRIKTSLLNSVSHELRSPLAAIKASVSSLRSGAVDWENPARADLLATVEEETDQLNLLVGNLLDMSRIEAGALNPKMQWNSIEEIIKSVVSKMKGQLSHYLIEYRLQNDLPLIPTDYVMMGQVFGNLISNSIKYAPQNTAIIFSVDRSEEGLRVMVTNQSPRVPEKHLDHIFDKFFRLSGTDKITGTGLGLSICRGIVEAHGGKIWAENRTEGFTFIMTLPVTLDGSLPELPKDETDG